MLWGFISAYQFGHLHIWKGTINAEKYMQVLEKHIQMGSFPLHILSITTMWLSCRRVKVLNWPTCSADLSPTEKI